MIDVQIYPTIGAHVLVNDHFFLPASKLLQLLDNLHPLPIEAWKMATRPQSLLTRQCPQALHRRRQTPM